MSRSKPLWFRHSCGARQVFVAHVHLGRESGTTVRCVGHLTYKRIRRSTTPAKIVNSVIPGEPVNNQERESSMSPAGDGNTIKVHYTGKLEDGTVFDSSEGRDPLEVTLGTNAVIPGFEKGLIGMEVGDKKTITIPSEEAYGPHHDNLIMEVNKSDFPEDITPEIGLQLQMQRPDGQTMPVMITAVDEKVITLDANHPLAGKTLIFDVEMMEVA